MRETILDKLSRTEKERGIDVLYAAESGSRAWGFASSDSDYDCRFIYKRPLLEYITIGAPKRDVIELPTEQKLDINGWDIFKALGLLSKSNPNLIEWLFSPVIYLESGGVAESMRQYSASYCNERACAYHYLNMAKGNYSRYIKPNPSVQRKKYLYVLRPLACLEWIRSNKGFPPVKFTDVLGGISLGCVADAMNSLLEEKVLGKEQGPGPHDALLDSYIQTSLDDFEQWALSSAVKKTDYKRLNRILHEEVFGVELQLLNKG